MSDASSPFAEQILTAGQQAVAEFSRLNIRAFQTGSAVIGSDRAIGDYDVVVEFSPDLHQFLREHGYIETEHPETEYPNISITSVWRNGDVNVIVPSDEHSYDKWSLATELACSMQLINKEQRVKLFQFITEGHVRGEEYIKVERAVRVGPVETPSAF